MGVAERAAGRRTAFTIAPETTLPAASTAVGRTGAAGAGEVGGGQARAAARVSHVLTGATRAPPDR